MSESAESIAAAPPVRALPGLDVIASRVVGMSAARVEWGVIIARVLMAGGLLAVALTNERAADLGAAAIVPSIVPILYTPLLAQMVRRGSVAREIVISALLDTAVILTGVTWAAAVTAQRVAENAAALTGDDIHQVEHDLYRPMLALVMFVTLRLRPRWGATFLICACLASLGLILMVSDGAFPVSSLAFQYVSLAITGMAALIVAMFIQQTREELENAIDDRSDLIQTVTHELGNPLAALKASLEMTDEEYGDKLDDDFRRLVRVSSSSVQRIESLARNLSALRSVDGRTLPPTLAPVVLEGLVQFAVDSMHPLATEREVSVIFRDHNDGPHTALANHDALDRILVNLISNAIKFSPREGVVEVGIRDEGDRLFIDVADEGPGVPSAEKSRLFNRYFRASNAVEHRVPGSGLGLFISRELALRMDGDVSVTDRPSGGSVFTIELRKARAANP